MKNKDKDRDPGRAHKRATADLRCAARKLGQREALTTILAMGTKGEHERALADVAAGIAQDLVTAALALICKLTEEELAAFEECAVSRAPAKYRLAKTLLVAVVRGGRIDNQWSAETIEPNVRKILRIMKRRP